MPRVIRWLFLIVIALALLTAIVYAMLPAPIPVDTTSAVIAPMRQTVDEEGKTRIRERYVVSSPLMGRLRRVVLDPGDAIEAERTVLAVIEPTDPELLDARALAEAEARVLAAEAAVRHAGATIERIRASYDFAENELNRITTAADQGAATRHEVDVATTAHRAAAEEFRAAHFGQEITQFELAVAESALLYAQGAEPSDDRARMPLYSPIDGAVLRVFQESVAVVTPGTPLLEVGDPRDLEVVIDVLSTDAVKVQPGDSVVIDHWGGAAPLSGVVRLVEPSAFTKLSALGIEEQRVNVIVDLITSAESRETLGDGFRVEAAIIVWEGESVLQIPTSAAFREGDDWAVFAVADGRAELRLVDVGRQNGRTTEITGGLKDGDTVIVHPSDQLVAGVRVQERASRAR